MFVTKPRLWLVCALEKISVIAFDALNVAADPSSWQTLCACERSDGQLRVLYSSLIRQPSANPKVWVWFPLRNTAFFLSGSVQSSYPSSSPPPFTHTTRQSNVSSRRGIRQGSARDKFASIWTDALGKWFTGAGQRFHGLPCNKAQSSCPPFRH